MVQNGMMAIHPGDFLAETLEELGITQAEFAQSIGVSSKLVSHVVRGARPVTADLALRLGRAFKQSPEYWMRLQSTFDA